MSQSGQERKEEEVKLMNDKRDGGIANEWTGGSRRGGGDKVVVKFNIRARWKQGRWSRAPLVLSGWTASVPVASKSAS